MNGPLVSMLDGKRILILGMGREGRSTLHFVLEHCKNAQVTITDNNARVLTEYKNYRGLNREPDYPGKAGDHDLVIVSPGIDRKTIQSLQEAGTRVTSQTGLFLKFFGAMTIGVTGTKGKSTTSSLLHYLLKKAGIPSLLVGNIGVPSFDVLGELTPHTLVVYEMSSSQLETVREGPVTGILLNLFPEHLDRYKKPGAYFEAKMGMIRGQRKGSNVIIPGDESKIENLMERYQGEQTIYRFSLDKKVETGTYIEGDHMVFRNDGEETMIHEDCGSLLLKGKHNLLNSMAAVTAAMIHGADAGKVGMALKEFRGLEHRLEYVGQFGGILYYNDSISTIPESCMRALESLEDVDTLILGGYDRGLDYSELYSFLSGSKVRNLVFMGPAGKRMAEEYRSRAGEWQRLVEVNTLEDAFPYIRENTLKDHVCLLSPAAASYDRFSNFEERGQLYKKLARSDGPLLTDD